MHTDQRKVVHKWFNPASMETWRPMVQKVVKDMLDEADQNGRMDVMKDFATPLPLFVIAQMMGMPFEDRKFIRSMAEKLLFIGRGRRTGCSPNRWNQRADGILVSLGGPEGGPTGRRE